MLLDIRVADREGSQIVEYIRDHYMTLPKYVFFVRVRDDWRRGRREVCRIAPIFAFARRRDVLNCVSSGRLRVDYEEMFRYAFAVEDVA